LLLFGQPNTFLAAVGEGQRLRLGPGQLLGGVAGGEQNPQVDPSANSLMMAVAAMRNGGKDDGGGNAKRRCVFPLAWLRI
jgi:hypothetical protein